MSEVYVDSTTPLNAVHMNALQQKVEKGVANGYASLNSSALVPVAQLPPSLPGDFVVPSGTRILTSKLLVGDAQPAFRIWADGKQEWGPGGATPIDANLYRIAAATLATDGRFYTRVAAAGNEAINVIVAGESQERIKIYSDARIYFGPGGSTGVDTNLYRVNAGELRTDGHISAVGRFFARVGTSEQIALGENGTIKFGSAGDTNLYRLAANTLKTDSFLDVQGLFKAQYGRITTRYGGPDQITIGDKGGDGATPTIVFGSAGDTNLYRSAASTLKTDGGFLAGLALASYYGAAQQIALGSVSGNAGIQFGSAADTNLYRSAADILKTDDQFQSGNAIVANVGAAWQTTLGGGGTGFATVYFGSANDTNLYRSSAGVLKTDGSLIVPGTGAGFPLTVAAGSGNGPLVLTTGAYRALSFQAALADANPAFALHGDGLMRWGPGGATPWDTNLYRFNAGALKTDGSLYAGNLLGALGSSDVSLKWSVRASDGMLQWGPGNAGQDTNLYRSQAGALKTDGHILVGVPGDTYGRVRLFSGTNGEISFGPGGASGFDSQIYRSAANQLKTQGMFIVSTFGISNYTSAAVGGSNIAKFPVYDGTGVLIGYVPIYQS